MVTRSRQSLTLGVIGAGEVSDETVEALLDDFIDSNGNGKAKFIVPATADLYNDGVKTVVAYADDHSLPYEVVTDDSTKGTKFKKVLAGATKTHKTANPVVTLVNLLDKATDARLLILWDDDDEEGMDALERASDKEIEALDLTSSLEVIELEGDDEVEAEDDDEVEADQDEDEEVGGSVTLSGDDGSSLTITEDAALSFDPENAEFSDLKAFAKDHGIEVPPRTKTAGYVRAILAWQAEASGHTDAPETDLVVGEDEPEDPALPEVSKARDTLSDALKGAVNAHPDGLLVYPSININIEVTSPDELAAYIAVLRS